MRILVGHSQLCIVVSTDPENWPWKTFQVLQCKGCRHAKLLIVCMDWLDRRSGSSAMWLTF